MIYQLRTYAHVHTHTQHTHVHVRVHTYAYMHNYTLINDVPYMTIMIHGMCVSVYMCVYV